MFYETFFNIKTMTTEPTFTPQRYLSIDFYRGLTIALMIIVNTPGTWEQIYAPLKHADWHGCTPTDLVFPSFMFIVGVSMWFAFERYERRWSADLGKKIFKRTVLIFLIGFLLNKFPFYWENVTEWRILGVLQRIALGYGIGSLLVLNLQRRWLIWVSTGILFAYWGVLYAFDQPNAAGLYSLGGNAVLQLDRFILGGKHLYKGEGIPFDPEGILSTFPAVVTVILGWLSGELMTKRRAQQDLLVRDLLVFGLISGFLGLAWDLFFPINKKLWTSSYVLYVGGLSMIFLAVSVWWIDVKKWTSGAGFFIVFGSNALFAYLLSEVLAIGLGNITWDSVNGKMSVMSWLYTTLFKPIEGAEFSSFLFAIAFMLICWIPCRWLYAKRIFIKL